MSRRLPDRMLERIPGRYRGHVPPEIPALWEHPERSSVLIASVVAMFALAIFPPFLSPGATAIQTSLKEDPASLGLIVLAGIASWRCCCSAGHVDETSYPKRLSTSIQP